MLEKLPENCKGFKINIAPKKLADKYFVVTSVVTIVADYRKIVAKRRN
jgi:hypothetical protein